jgi:hypothetical protein
MGLVIIGMCIYLLFPISLCVGLIWYIIKNTKEIGFLKAVKSKTAIVLIVLIFMCGGLFISGFIPRSGKQLFKDYILNPMPKSVKILDSFDGNPDFYPETCLHFKISPDDFQLILASKKWEVVSDDTFVSLSCSDSLKSPWDFTYSPPPLGGNVIIYTFIPNERDDEIMFTNAQMNEVYYKYYDGYMP